MTGLGFAVENGVVFTTDLRESLRDGAVDLIATLQRQGIGCEILSGDSEAAVSLVANQVGISQAHAQLRPGEKLTHLQRLAARGHKALMVGDGLNDAPALAAAHVSMAPASASDAGRMAADFVFTRGDLRAVGYTLDVARRTGAIVKQNFILAIAYNALAVPLAMAGYLNPLIAAVAMSTSSILVVGNSLRLHWVQPPKSERLPHNRAQEPAFAESLAA